MDAFVDGFSLDGLVAFTHVQNQTGLIHYAFDAWYKELTGKGFLPVGEKKYSSGLASAELYLSWQDENTVYNLQVVLLARCRVWDKSHRPALSIADIERFEENPSTQGLALFLQYISSIGAVVANTLFPSGDRSIDVILQQENNSRGGFEVLLTPHVRVV